MGKRKTKKMPKRKQLKSKTPMMDRPRKLQQDGTIKPKRGDLKMIRAGKVSFSVKQKKGGKWIKTGERKCKIHTVCNCVTRTDPRKMTYVTNR